ncbi:hypothetical protein EV182_003902, partial [Spiromyces aspiralis]
MSTSTSLTPRSQYLLASSDSPGGSCGGPNSRCSPVMSGQEERKSLLFPEALYAVLEDPSNHDWIRWDDNGLSFRFNDYDKLLKALTLYGVRARMKPSVSKNLN